MAMTVGVLDHFNIRTRKLADTVRFYEDVLGLEKGDRPNFAFPGAWMYSAAAGWLMTSLDPSPFAVSLVQVASSLPMFLLALPAGALADIFDRRRFILVLEIATAVISALFAALVSAGLVGPAILLFFLFLIGSVSAFEAPAWQAVVPQLVPAEDLTVAIIEHTMEAMVRLADTFLVLDHGAVLVSGPPEEVTRNPKVIEAYLGKKWMDHAYH